MPYNRKQSSRRDDDRRDSRSSNRGSSRGGRQQQQRQSEYFPIFSAFSNEGRGGSRSVQFKRYETKNASIEDTLTLEQWLHIAEKLYYGDVTLTCMLWEADERYADMTGNVRLRDDQLEEWLADYEEPKKASKQKPKSAKPASKPKYEVPPEDDEEEEDYEDEGEQEEAEEDSGDY